VSLRCSGIVASLHGRCLALRPHVTIQSVYTNFSAHRFRDYYINYLKYDHRQNVQRLTDLCRTCIMLLIKDHLSHILSETRRSGLVQRLYRPQGSPTTTQKKQNRCANTSTNRNWNYFRLQMNSKHLLLPPPPRKKRGKVQGRTGLTMYGVP
jgi:hypothetical protein